MAHHDGGPADGHTVRIDKVEQTRHYASASERSSKEWITLARYIHVPPRDGKHVHYRYTGQSQTRGPVPGGEHEPDWS